MLMEPQASTFHSGTAARRSGSLNRTSARSRWRGGTPGVIGPRRSRPQVRGRVPKAQDVLRMQKILPDQGASGTKARTSLQSPHFAAGGEGPTGPRPGIPALQSKPVRRAKWPEAIFTCRSKVWPHRQLSKSLVSLCAETERERAVEKAAVPAFASRLILLPLLSLTLTPPTLENAHERVSQVGKHNWCILNGGVPEQVGPELPGSALAATRGRRVRDLGPLTWEIPVPPFPIDWQKNPAFFPPFSAPTQATLLAS